MENTYYDFVKKVHMRAFCCNIRDTIDKCALRNPGYVLSTIDIVNLKL